MASIAEAHEGEGVGGMRSAAALVASIFAGARSGAAAPAAAEPPPSAPVLEAVHLPTFGFPEAANPGWVEGIPEPVERMHRLTGSMASSVFDELLNGALQPVDTGPPPASEKAIQSLDSCVACDESTRCPICLSDLEEATKMPCGHLFHNGCLLKWLRAHNTCPVCRTTVEASESPNRATFSALLQGWQGAGATSAMRRALLERAGAQPMAPETQSTSTQTIQGHLRDNVIHLNVPARGFMAAAPPSAPLFTEEELERMSVTELKRHLTDLSVDFSDAIEKSDLLALLRERLQPPRMHLQVQMEVLEFPFPHLLPPAATQNPAAPAAAAASAAASAALRFRVLSAPSAAGLPPVTTFVAAAPPVPPPAPSAAPSAAPSNVPPPAANPSDARAARAARRSRGEAEGAESAAGSSSHAAEAEGSAEPQTRKRQRRGSKS